MVSELASSNRVVGVKQSRKAIREGRAAKVFLAADADPAVTGPIEEDCAARGIPMESEHTMAQIGKACRIMVGVAVAVLLNEQ